MSPLQGGEDEVSFRSNVSCISAASFSSEAKGAEGRKEEAVASTFVPSPTKSSASKSSAKKHGGYDSFQSNPSETLGDNINEMLASFENNYEANKSAADISEVSKSFASIS